LRQARKDWATREDLRDTYRQYRPMVERSIAWLIGPKGRCRRLRYRGVISNDQWLGMRMAALNLRRMINMGLQPATGGGWIIPEPA
jgi:Transposase DDE domain